MKIEYWKLKIMKVILLQDIPKVGRKNEIKEVSDGYARNFLLAKNLARPATLENVKVLENQKVKEEKEKSEENQKCKALAERLKSTVLNFKVRVGEKGRAFGSVTAAKIRDELKKHGIEITKDQILLEESIKTVGENVVRVKLADHLMIELKLVVEAESTYGN